MNLFVLLAVNAAVLAFMFYHLKRRIDRRLSSAGLLENVRKEVGGIILELNKTTDRNIGLIEERLSVLKEFLETADKRILLIKREAEKHEVSAQVYSQILQKKNAARDESPPQEGGRKTVSSGEVVDLHNKGISSGVIATRLGTTVGEVELIISLQDGKVRGGSGA